jgi:hypothetical protein
VVAFANIEKRAVSPPIFMATSKRAGPSNGWMRKISNAMPQPSHSVTSKEST